MSDEPELCQHCESNELISISAKHSDAFACTYINDTSQLHHDGYGFDDSPWEDGERWFGDYLDFTLCITCGLIKGNFPLTLSDIKTALHGHE